jgi:hypothetical protein
MACRSLSNLSDKRLLSDLRDLVKKERQTTLAILLHLAEVDRRELYLIYGFSSLYDYCVGALNYSRSSAGRRIATARCIRRFPEVFDLLDSGDVKLTAMGFIAPILDDENKDLLLLEIRNKTQQQIETIVARYKPPVAYRDRVKPVRVAVPIVGEITKTRCNSLIFNSHSGSNPSGRRAMAAAGFDAGPVTGFTGKLIGGSPAGTGVGAGFGVGATTGTPAGRAATHAGMTLGSSRLNGVGDFSACPEKEDTSKVPASGPRSRIEKRLLVQFLASEMFMAKLDEVKSLLSIKMPAGTFEDVFAVLIDEFIERHSPAKKQQRREKRKSRSIELRNASSRAAKTQRTFEKGTTTKKDNVARKGTQTSGLGSNPPGKSRRGTQVSNRQHIPAAVRDKVSVRDNGRCSYVGKDGKQCGSKRNLQVDHIVPVARGGTNRLLNLRLLCGKHNRLEAKRVLGADVTNRYKKKH